MVEQMIEQTAHIEMDADPAHVCAVASALDWIGPGMAVTRLDGGTGLDGRYQLRTHALGTEFAFTVLVDATGQPHRLGFRTVDARECSFEGEYRIESRGGLSHVTLDVRAKPHGRYRFMQPMIAPLLHHALHDALGRLRDRAEMRSARAA
jgi:polyketide cyclase/dehydrase/lipid transport protein